MNRFKQKLAETTKSIKLLRLFSKNPNVVIRISVARNPNSNLDILERLSEDFFWRVREYVVIHPNVSLKILENLSEDNVFSVMIKAKEILKRNKKWKKTDWFIF